MQHVDISLTIQDVPSTGLCPYSTSQTFTHVSSTGDSTAANRVQQSRRIRVELFDSRRQLPPTSVSSSISPFQYHAHDSEATTAMEWTSMPSGIPEMRATTVDHLGGIGCFVAGTDWVVCCVLAGAGPVNTRGAKRYFSSLNDPR